MSEHSDLARSLDMAKQMTPEQAEDEMDKVLDGMEQIHDSESVTLSGRELAQWRAVPEMVKHLRYVLSLAMRDGVRCAIIQSGGLDVADLRALELEVNAALAAYEEA